MKKENQLIKDYYTTHKQIEENTTDEKKSLQADSRDVSKALGVVLHVLHRKNMLLLFFSLDASLTLGVVLRRTKARQERHKPPVSLSLAPFLHVCVISFKALKIKKLSSIFSSCQNLVGT